MLFLGGDSYVASEIKMLAPDAVWDALKSKADAVLVDVRTQFEWSYIGIPDLTSIGKEPILIEWKSLPLMEQNETFAEDLDNVFADNQPSEIYFLCRSGVRSHAAAGLMQAHYAARGQKTECINIAEGFEGDIDSNGHRGTIGGWKSHGLAWRQS